MSEPEQSETRIGSIVPDVAIEDVARGLHISGLNDVDQLPVGGVEAEIRGIMNPDPEAVCRQLRELYNTIGCSQKST